MRRPSTSSRANRAGSKAGVNTSAPQSVQLRAYSVAVPRWVMPAGRFSHTSRTARPGADGVTRAARRNGSPIVGRWHGRLGAVVIRAEDPSATGTGKPREDDLIRSDAGFVRLLRRRRSPPRPPPGRSLWSRKPLPAHATAPAVRHPRPRQGQRQTRCGVHGMSRWRTPRWFKASMTAFCTAGVEPIVVASPIPLAPSGLRG